MSTIISTEQKNVERQVISRTYNISIVSDHNDEYRAVIHRERLTYIDGTAQHPPNREPVAASAGDVAQGEDGTDPSHYPDANGGFVNKLKVPVSELEARQDAIIIDSQSIPIKNIPVIIAAMCDKLIEEELEARKTQVVDAAVAAASG
jgi:hypothetical protein